MAKDYINNKGASRKLAELINTYWKKNGKPWVRAYVEAEEHPTADGVYNEIYVIRSNLGFKWNKGGQYYSATKL